MPDLMGAITIEVLLNHHGTNEAMARSTMAAVECYWKFHPFVSYTIFTNEATNVTDTVMRNSLVVFIGVIFILKGCGKGFGHSVLRVTMLNKLHSCDNFQQVIFICEIRLQLFLLK